MPNRLPALLALSLAAGPVAAQDVTDFTLENGMEIVVIEDHRAPVVTNMVWYRTGSADEPAGESGVAHFLEHLMFQGTHTMQPGEFSATVDAQGGNDNAFTSYDYTAYFQRVAADRLDLMLSMEADRMRNLTLSEEIVANERNVVLEERSQRVDSEPSSIFDEQRRAAQFLNSPYGIPVIGWRAEMEQMDREDALRFYRTYYAPNNAILVVAGDVTPDEVLGMAKKHFGKIQPSADLPVRLRPQEPPQLSERRLSYADPRVAQPYVSRSYLAVERNTGDQAKAAALTVLAEYLGGSPTTSVLARALQFGADASAIYTHAYYDGTAVDPTTFSVAVVPRPGVTLGEAEQAMDAAIEQFLTDGIEAEAFERIMTQIRAAEIYARDDSDALARRYGAALAVGLTVEDEENWPQVLQSVTPEQVMEAAHEVFDKRRAVTGHLMQEEAAE